MNKRNDCVILLHGFARTKSVMNKIQNALSDNGFSVINWSYNSITKNISAIAEDLNDMLKAKAEEFSQFSFVTHSLGGIVLRRLLKKYPGHKIRKVVMIAPPNQGASLARIANGLLTLINCIPLKPVKIIAKGALLLTPPVLTELMDRDYLTKKCAVPKCKFIIISGKKSDRKTVTFSFLRNICLGDVPNDGTVTIEETKLPGCEEHLVVNESHTSILSSKIVIKKIVEYLK